MMLSSVQGTRTTLKGAKYVSVSPFCDERGAFVLFWENEALLASGLTFNPNTCAFSHNLKSHTLRGLHSQRAPYEQSKFVMCSRGRIWDVIVDLRRDSPSYLDWAGVELTETSGLAVFIPPGYAHGFVTLSDDSTLTYLMDGVYQPDFAITVRWDDPTIKIEWPVSNPILSARDRTANFID